MNKIEGDARYIRIRYKYHTSDSSIRFSVKMDRRSIFGVSHKRKT
jgi:hypothetical protein